MRVNGDGGTAGPAFAGGARLKEAVIVGAVVIGAFALRLYFFRYHPVMVPDYDGAEYLALGGKVFSGQPFYTSFIPPGFPFLLGIALPFFGSPQAAGMVVSALFGSGLCLAVYLFSREMFGRKAALAAAVLAACLGQLVVTSGWVMSEMPFAFLMYMGLYAALVFGRRRDVFSAAAAGGLLGAAYLVRPDAAPIFALWLLLACWQCIRGGARIGELARGLGAAVAVFLLMALPYLVYLRRALGAWSISGKLGYNLAVTKGGALSGGSLGYALANAGPLAAKYQHNFQVLWQQLSGDLGPQMLLVSAAGMAASALWLKGRPLGFWYPALVVVYMLVLPFFVVDERVITPYYPALLVWAAAGIGFAEERLRSVAGTAPARWLSGVTPAAVVLLCALQGHQLFGFYASAPYAEFTEALRVQYRGTAEWLRRNTAPGEKVISRELLYVFYAGREYVQLPDSPPAEIARLARERGARYVVVDNACVLKRQALGPLLRPFVAGPYNGTEFREVYRVGTTTGGVLIYEVEGGA